MSDGADLYRVQMGIPIGFFASDSCLEASVWISAIRLSDVSGFFDVIAGFFGFNLDFTHENARVSLAISY